jgi:hypothetical protein
MYAPLYHTLTLWIIFILLKKVILQNQLNQQWVYSRIVSPICTAQFPSKSIPEVDGRILTSAHQAKMEKQCEKRNYVHVKHLNS